MTKLNQEIITIAVCILIIIAGIVSVPIMDMDATFCLLALCMGACGIYGTLFHTEKGE